MKKLPQEVPFTNTTKQNKHVGGRVIRPGHTRMVLAIHHPNYKALAAGIQQDAPVDTRLADLLKLNAPKVLEAILAKPEDFSDADLEQLAALEGQAKQPRKSLLAGIQEQLLERARAHDGEGIKAMLEGEDVAKGLLASEDLSVDDLNELGAAENAGKKRPDVLLAIQEKFKAITRTACTAVLAGEDPAKAIAESKTLSLYDLDILDAIEMEADKPRDAVVDAIEAKRAELKKSGGMLGGLRGLFGAKK